MEYQFTFQRTEKKYLLNAAQFITMKQLLNDRMQPDQFGRHTIISLYYDTPDHYLIRRSLEHPVYKEKLRLRSYTDTDLVFPEIKKKYKGIVYKRRIACTAQDWEHLRAEGTIIPGQSEQIQRELCQVLRCYPGLEPRVLIAYERTAYAEISGDLRITFDEDPRAREDALTLNAGSHGAPLLAPGMVVMEIKFPGSAPLWLAQLLSENRIFPTSFSKYGRWYQQRCKANTVNRTDTKGWF